MQHVHTSWMNLAQVEKQSCVVGTFDKLEE